MERTQADNDRAREAIASDLRDLHACDAHIAEAVLALRGYHSPVAEALGTVHREIQTRLATVAESARYLDAIERRMRSEQSC